MERLKSFVKTSLLGGFIVVLPLAISIVVLSWLFRFILGFVQPITYLIIFASNISEFLAQLISITIILVGCFSLGVAVRTSLGKYIFQGIEDYLLQKIPGYRVIKETTFQIIGKDRTMFTSVALVNMFGTDTMATAFITDEHPDGSFTVFVPTGPNPTSGFMYHMKKEHVHKIDFPLDEAMRTVISCGSGSKKLMERYRQGLS